MMTSGGSLNKRKKYPIADLRSLEEYIMSNEAGLVVDEDLKEWYEGIEEHIEGILLGFWRMYEGRFVILCLDTLFLKD